MKLKNIIIITIEIMKMNRIETKIIIKEEKEMIIIKRMSIK
jgi:hypothetical protein